MHTNYLRKNNSTYNCSAMNTPDLIVSKRERKQAEVYKVLNIAPVNRSVSIQVTLCHLRSAQQNLQYDTLTSLLNALSKSYFNNQTGTGIKLSEYPFFLKGLEKVKGDDDIVKALHMLMFSSIGRKFDAKKNIRLFSGFADDSAKGEKKSKVTENKKKWTVQLLKDAMSLFGLEKGGSRHELVDRLIDYLMLPSVLKHDVSSAGSKKKTTSSSKTKGTKRKATMNDTAPKKKRAPTSYILFSTAMRDEIKSANSDASFAEIGALLGQKWKTLNDDEKKVHFCYTSWSK